MKKPAFKRNVNHSSITASKAEYHMVTNAGRVVRCASGRCCRSKCCLAVKGRLVQPWTKCKIIRLSLSRCTSIGKKHDSVEKARNAKK